MARVEPNVPQVPHEGYRGEPYRRQSNGNVRHEAYAGTTEDRVTYEVAAGGSGVAAIVGAGGAVLAILALVNVLPMILLAIAEIAVGAGLAVESGALGARYADTFGRERSTRRELRDLGGGMVAEFLTGLAGITFGILALVAVDPVVLLGIGAVVMGAGFFFGSGATARLNRLTLQTAAGPEFGQQVTTEGARGTAGVQAFIGLGALALGILAVIGLAPMVLAQIALIGLGAGLMLSGGMIGGRLMREFYRRY